MLPAELLRPRLSVDATLPMWSVELLRSGVLSREENSSGLCERLAHRFADREIECFGP